MISTPETGVDSVAISYALLGPFFAVARPIAAVSSAVFTGLLAAFIPDPQADVVPDEPEESCCSESCDSQPSSAADPGPWRKTFDGISYALGDILDDIALWLGIGLVIAGVITTFVPEQALVEWGSGSLAMIVMLLVGVPMYICATASTPLAASFLIAGVSPGAVMVFLLAGPATNIATIAVVRSEMGTRTMIVYLAGVCISSLAAGFVVNALFGVMAIDVTTELSAGSEFVPFGIAAASAILLALLLAKRLPRKLFPRLARSCC
jgi:hypothetical protein